jgi:hypothetical protein
VPEHQTTNKQTTILEFLSINIILFTDDCISEIKHLFSYLRLSNPSYHTVSFISPLTLIHHCVSVSKDHTWNNITFCFTSGLLCLSFFFYILFKKVYASIYHRSVLSNPYFKANKWDNPKITPLFDPIWHPIWAPRGRFLIC